MHVKGFLHKILPSVIHKKRLTTLTILVETLLDSKKLSLTALGRAIKLPIKERSGIRRVDRFLGNQKFHQECEAIHQIIINHAVGSSKRPHIIVDWSSIPNTTHHTLRAALAANGRAITLYEEVHVEKKLSNKKVHNAFLKKLKALLPEDCKPIIITDAGFYNDWFKEVVKLGWDFIGRVRGKKYVRKISEETWQFSRELFNKATSTPKNIGEVELCKSNSMTVTLCLFKGKSPKRKRAKKSGKKPLEYRKAAKEPWLLATSLSDSYFLAKRVIEIYSLRMQIEEGFRDLKSPRYGFGFEYAHSKKLARIEVLLLIGTLASFIAWLTGWVAEKNNIHYQFQSNSIKNRRVLSLFFLGCQIIKKKIKISVNMIMSAIDEGLTCGI